MIGVYHLRGKRPAVELYKGATDLGMAFEVVHEARRRGKRGLFLADLVLDLPHWPTRAELLASLPAALSDQELRALHHTLSEELQRRAASRPTRG